MDTQSQIGVPDLLARRDTSGLVGRMWWKASLEALNSGSVCYVTFLVYILHSLQLVQGVPGADNYYRRGGGDFFFLSGRGDFGMLGPEKPVT